jgi:AcrR family transcriptional regulator
MLDNRVWLTKATITAATVVDEHGVAGLTLAAVADRTGVAAPSLYKHLRGMTNLRNRLAVLVVDEMAHDLRAATLGHSPGSRTAGRHAGLSGLRDRPPESLRRAAAGRADRSGTDRVRRAAADHRCGPVAGYRLSGVVAVHAARCFRAAAHGFASLRAAGAFGLPHDLDASYAQLVDALIMGMNQGGTP